MEVSFIVKTFSKEDRALSTEKVFLGRLCEEAASVFLERAKSWQVTARNVRFRIGEIDLITQCRKTGQNWAVEVRSRRGNKRNSVQWLSRRKINKLKTLVRILSLQTNSSYRLLFVQVEIISIGVPKDFPSGWEWKMKLNEFEVTQDC